nr:MAG TPA: hypothetical protein [Caudoviricetes sp.]
MLRKGIAGRSNGRASSSSAREWNSTERNF